jgi:hypothetical protein
MDQGAEGLGHGLGVDHRHHRNAEAAGDVGARRAAVEQPHHPFDEDQVGLWRGGVQAPGGVGRAAHAQIEVVDRRPLATAWICGSRKSGPHLNTAPGAPGGCAGGPGRR